MEVVVTNTDIAVHYEVEGKGIPLILLHGQFMNMTMFNVFEKDLLDKFQLIKIDLCGHGYSDKPLAISMEDYVDNVICVMDSLYIQHANFLGYGLGGMVAQAFAARYPERIDKLIVIGNGDEPIHKSEARFFMNNAELMRTLSPSERRGVLHNSIYHHPKVVKKWLQKQLDTMAYMTAHELNAVTASTEQYQVLETARLIQCPVLMINGKYDVLVTPENGAALESALKNVQYLIYENSGHAPLIEEKERFIKDVRAFLEPQLPL